MKYNKPFNIKMLFSLVAILIIQDVSSQALNGSFILQENPNFRNLDQSPLVKITSKKYVKRSISEEEIEKFTGKTCSSTTNICPSCKSMAVCISLGDGTYKTLTHKCREDEVCMNGSCMKGNVCNQGEFTCKQEGYFPDIHDCKKYHVCLPNPEGGFTNHTYSCTGTAYDPARVACGLSLNSQACKRGPVPECLARTQIGAVPTATSIYYFCVESDDFLVPELYMCPKNQEFNVKTKSCQLKAALGKF